MTTKVLLDLNLPAFQDDLLALEPNEVAGHINPAQTADARLDGGLPRPAPYMHAEAGMLLWDARRAANSIRLVVVHEDGNGLVLDHGQRR
jgi:hypothetical protein